MPRSAPECSHQPPRQEANFRLWSAATQINFQKRKKEKKNTLPAAFAVIHLHNIHSYRKTYSEHF